MYRKGGIGTPCGLACKQPVMEHRDDARLPLKLCYGLGSGTFSAVHVGPRTYINHQSHRIRVHCNDLADEYVTMTLRVRNQDGCADGQREYVDMSMKQGNDKGKNE